MDDRKLLELAANAVGGSLFDGTSIYRTGETWDEWIWSGHFGIKMPNGTILYPHINNGHALELALYLDMDIKFNRVDEWVEVVVGYSTPITIREQFGNDPLAATRHSIVRAAATLGEISPPSRKWVGLTDQDIDMIWRNHLHRDSRARAIESLLKEKNYG